VFLFIDTNVLLSFYAFTQDDLERLEKLGDQIDAGHLTAYKTKQVEDEFRRNRERKIYEATKDMRGRTLSLGLSRLCDQYPETLQLRRLAREYAELHTELVRQIDGDADCRQLKADVAVDKLLAGATLIGTSPDLIDQARTRIDLGNPPGKKGSLGDAMNWEALLAERPGGDLYVVTDDVDFYADSTKTKPRNYLVDEWTKTVGTSITFVRRLSELPQLDPIPPEVLPIDESGDDRDDLIADLQRSPNFAVTHALIASLARFNRFTDEQVDGLITAAMTNQQVGWILGDPDLASFYEWLIKTHGDLISPDDIKTIMAQAEPL
jgi:hypothetical protein